MRIKCNVEEAMTIAQAIERLIRKIRGDNQVLFLDCSVNSALFRRGWTNANTCFHWCQKVCNGTVMEIFERTIKPMKQLFRICRWITSDWKRHLPFFLFVQFLFLSSSPQAFGYIHPYSLRHSLLFI